MGELLTVFQYTRIFKKMQRYTHTNTTPHKHTYKHHTHTHTHNTHHTTHTTPHTQTPHHTHTSHTTHTHNTHHTTLHTLTTHTHTHTHTHTNTLLNRASFSLLYMELSYLYLRSQFKVGHLTRHGTVMLFIPTMSIVYSAQCDFIIIHTRSQ
jgi:hypothetical protein